MEIFSRHCANGSSHIKGVDFDKSYSPVAHSESFRINISVEYIHRLTARISDVSNAFQNTNVPIHDRFCVSPPPYYFYWFEISYPNVPLSQYYRPFFLQFMNGIKGTKPDGQQWNIILYTVVTTFKYKKSTIYHAIYIKVFTYGTVSYLTVSTDDVLYTTNNDISFPELRRVF